MQKAKPTAVRAKPRFISNAKGYHADHLPGSPFSFWVIFAWFAIEEIRTHGISRPLSSQRQKATLEGGLSLIGGDEEARTPDLRIANATLSQLSYVPLFVAAFSTLFQTLSECNASALS